MNCLLWCFICLDDCDDRNLICLITRVVCDNIWFIVGRDSVVFIIVTVMSVICLFVIFNSPKSTVGIETVGQRCIWTWIGGVLIGALQVDQHGGRGSTLITHGNQTKNRCEYVMGDGDSGWRLLLELCARASEQCLTTDGVDVGTNLRNNGIETCWKREIFEGLQSIWCVCQIRERPTVDVICGVVNLKQKKNEHKITQTIREFSK